MFIGIKSELVSASFWSFDDYPEQLLVIGFERLEAGGVCETILFAHSDSDLYCNVDALSEQKVCSLRGTSRPTPEVDYWNMRKRLIATDSQGAPHSDHGWLDLESAAAVEVTSEAKEYPVEFALVSGEMRGWRAETPGTQTIRLIFDKPQKLSRISLVFEERETERTQELVLRWSPDGGRSFREIVRQQWNFSPPDTIREVEEYRVELSDVGILELVIVPDINRGAARASLMSLRLS